MQPARLGYGKAATDAGPTEVGQGVEQKKPLLFSVNKAGFACFDLLLFHENNHTTK